MYPSVSRDQLIINWYKRSQKQRATKITVFDQFIYLWFAFNAWGTSLSQKDRDSKMLCWIKRHSNLPQIHKVLIKNDSDYYDKVLRIAGFHVQNMRPGHQEDVKSIDSIHNFDQLLDLIYQVRCNLFHGQKSIIDERDSELVELSFHVLSRIFSHIIYDLQNS